MPTLEWQEIVIALVIAGIVFGAGRIPEIGRSLGKTVRTLRSRFEDPGTTAPSGTPAAGAGLRDAAGPRPADRRGERAKDV